MPSWSRGRSASRSVVRLTPNWRSRTRSGGRKAPGASCPALIWVIPIAESRIRETRCRDHGHGRHGDEWRKGLSVVGRAGDVDRRRRAVRREGHKSDIEGPGRVDLREDEGDRRTNLRGRANRHGLVKAQAAVAGDREADLGCFAVEDRPNGIDVVLEAQNHVKKPLLAPCRRPWSVSAQQAFRIMKSCGMSCCPDGTWWRRDLTIWRAAGSLCQRCWFPSARRACGGWGSASLGRFPRRSSASTTSSPVTSRMPLTRDTMR